MKSSFVKVKILSLIILVIVSCKKEDVIDEINNEINIGLLIPYTGSGASTGESIDAAIAIALEDINSYLETIDSDKTIKIFAEDSGTDTIQSLNKIKILKERGVRMVIGPYSSASVKAVKDYADQNGILIISPSSVAPSLAIPGDNIYRLVTNDNSQAEALTALLNDDSIRALVPIVRDDIWGKELLETTTLQFENTSGNVKPAVKYPTNTSDFSTYIEQLKTNVNTAIAQYTAEKVGVYLVSFGEGTEILKIASSEEDLEKIKWYGSSAYADNSSLIQETVAAEFAREQDLVCPIFGYDENAEDKWQPLITKISAEIGRKPEIYALVCYDALWLATLTHLSCGVNADIEKVRNAFVHEANNYFGATGRTALNEAGDRAYAKYDFWGITFNFNYMWEVVAKYNNATGELVRY